MATRRDDDYGFAQRGGSSAYDLEPDAEPETPRTQTGWPGKRSVSGQLAPPAGPVRRKAEGDDGPTPGARALLADAASSPGGSLPTEMRGRLEQSLNADLSGVQVHSGSASAAAARAVGAAAYTVGQQIHFGTGLYAPGSPAGDALIAHEVAHTVQQRGSSGDIRQDKLEISSPGDAHEIEAESFAQSFVASQPGVGAPASAGPVVASPAPVTAVTPVSAGTVSRMLISRTPPDPPAPATGATPAVGPAAPVRSAVVSPTVTVAAGGLAPGRPRVLPVVFRGDRLTFTATVAGVTQAEVETGVMGNVVGAEAGPPTITWTSPTTIQFVVTVGNMGRPNADLAQPPDLVEAKPFVKLNAAPFTWLGDRIFRFRVLADLQWLSDRADIAAGDCSAEYHSLLSRINLAYIPYKAAYLAHKAALENRAKRDQLAQDIAIGILFAGVGGAAGGVVQQLVRGSSGALARIGTATALGDITKYVVRLGAGHSGGGGGGGNTTDTPTSDPSAGAGSATGGAGFDPDNWKAQMEARVNDEAQTMLRQGGILKRALSEAWAAGRTELMDQDPVDILKPYQDSLASVRVPRNTQQQYANDLWFEWVHLYGYTIFENSLGFRAVTDNVGGKLADDIEAQCGPQGADMLRVLREAAWERARMGDNPRPWEH